MYNYIWCYYTQKTSRKGNIRMKKLIKKIVSIAMAFTILGAGSVITETVNPQLSNTITVSAACSHTVGSSSYGAWTLVEKKQWGGWFSADYIAHSKRTVKCTKCGKTAYTQHKNEYYLASTIYTGCSFITYHDLVKTEYWTTY